MRLSSSRSTAILHRPQQDFLLWDRAGTRPSLDQQFADRKDLIDAISGQQLITFTRASAGTYVGGDGLIKTATTNLSLQSEDFSTTWITSNASVTVNDTAAPDGSITADKVVVSSPGLSVRQEVSGSFAAGSTYIASVWVKADGSDIGKVLKIGLRRADATALQQAYSEFVLTGDWQRISRSITWSVARTAISFDIRTDGVSGIAASNFYIWGAQLEQSTTVGEYIPTTSTINSAPRFDHDPTTGESLGLLVEESRTNLLLQSEDFSTTWTLVNTTASTNHTVAPDGLTTADGLYETAATGEHRTRQFVTGLAANTNHTVSAYIKDIGGRNVQIRVLDTDNVANGYLAVFSPSTGTIVTAATSVGSGTAVSASIVDAQNGWYRVLLTGNGGATCTKYTIDLFSFSGTTANFAGDITKGFYAWGAQLEAGSFPTSYIPTTGSTVTRAADVASISGSNFSSWFNATEGTMFANFQWTTTTARHNSSLFRFDDGSNNNFINLGFRNVSPSAPGNINVRVSGGSPIETTTGTVSTNDGIPHRLAGTYTSFEGAISGDGQAPGSSILAGLPVVTTARIGSSNVGVPSNFAMYIRRLTYWPQRLPDSTLQTITQ